MSSITFLNVIFQRIKYLQGWKGQNNSVQKNFSKHFFSECRQIFFPRRWNPQRLTFFPEKFSFPDWRPSKLFDKKNLKKRKNAIFQLLSKCLVFLEMTESWPNNCFNKFCQKMPKKINQWMMNEPKIRPILVFFHHKTSSLGKLVKWNQLNQTNGT